MSWTSQERRVWAQTRSKEFLAFLSLLEAFFCLSIGRNTRLSYASITALAWSGSDLWLHWQPRWFWIFLLWPAIWHKIAERTRQITISHIVCQIPELASLLSNLSQVIISALRFEPGSFSAFHLCFPIPLLFLNTPPGMESRCGTGRRRDCSLGHKQWKGAVGRREKMLERH